MYKNILANIIDNITPPIYEYTYPNFNVGINTIDTNVYDNAEAETDENITININIINAVNALNKILNIGDDDFVINIL